jgi:integrating conjugative element protein (TIGR03746 family)
MPSRFLNALDNASLLIRVQWFVIAALFLVTVFAVDGLRRAPSALDLHIPPDISQGAVVHPGEVPDPNVYAFALVIWQQINRWTQNGEKDYGQQIFTMAPYLTPACREQLADDLNLKANRGELNMRTRAMGEIPGQSFSPERVRRMASGIWHVTLDTEIDETLHGQPVKHALVRYPLRVLRYQFDPQRNPYGLALDCVPRGEEPVRLDPREVGPDTAKAPATVPSKPARPAQPPAGAPR